MRLNRISREDIRQWIDGMAETKAHNTVKNAVAVAKGLYYWLLKEGKYDGLNPFTGHEWKAKGIEREVKPTVSLQELGLVLSSTESHQLRQSTVLGYYTGLRASEVYRIRPDDFSHENLILKVRESKTRQGTRLIAIPKILSIWVINSGLEEVHGKTVENLMVQLKSREMSLAGMCMASFRKNFATVMELAGAGHETIDAHQGRFQSAVIARHYLRDKMRAVNLMRPFISKVFDGEDGHVLRVVK